MLSREEKKLIASNLQTFLLFHEQFSLGEGKEKKLKSDREIGEQLLGVSKQTVGRWWKGEGITFDLLYHLHKEYHLNINWLFTGKGSMLSKS